MPVDQEYTTGDHEFRDDDLYALAKYRLTLRWLARHAPKGSLLNIGCGGGVFSQMAFDAGYHVRGIEPDPVACQIAETRAASRYEVDNSGLFDEPGTSTYGAVVMHDVLEHINAEGAAVAALADLLKPGGFGVVSVPALESLFGYHDVQLGHFRRYTRTSLTRALNREFEVMAVRYLGFAGVPVALWYSRIRQAPYPIATASAGPINTLVRAVCAVEERIPGPVGTSVLALIRKTA